MRSFPVRTLSALALLTLLFLVAPATAPTALLAQEDGEDTSKLDAETFKGLELRSIGPALMSGRIADIAVHPGDQSVWYVAVGSGGVWKTTNAGTTWTPIFDDQGSYSIGDVTVDPSEPSTVWVGTGENVGGRHVGYGDGVYKSLDGGQTWQHMGLEQSEHIGNIVVDPRDSNVVFVAAQGPLWSAGGQRGLYKTTDGGETWKLVLSGEDVFAQLAEAAAEDEEDGTGGDGSENGGAEGPGPDYSDYTGVNEVQMDPSNPDVLYAATHQRYRNVAALLNGGPGSAIFKSTDGGETWRRLTTGLPSEDVGKIGLAVSPLDPSIVYATIEVGRRQGGFYRSTDGGESWEKRSDYLSGGTGPHYYQEIFASPHELDRVYQMDVRLHVTEDGGKTFREVGEEWKHGDNHAMAFDPKDPNYLLVGSDGGLYESWDLGKNWKFVTNLPVTQFYKLAVDNDLPFYNIYGGTQDNNTQGGPSRTTNTSGIRSSDWFITLFADGHQPAVDPTNPDIVYSEWQQGNLVRYDRKTGEIVYIQPQPEPGDPPERFNWDAPILISPHDPARLYYASQRVWRSDDRGDSWRPISGDLSRGEERLKEPMMGRVWSIDAAWDLWAMSNYGTVTSLAESPLEEGLIYAGTDDGLIQVTEDGGETWRKIDRLPGVPAKAFVNDLKADLHDADTVYAVLDDHKSGDFQPYLMRSTDRGRTWEPMVGDLPDRHILWRIVQDHEDPDLFFLGTEFGIFFTLDAGQKWIELEGGVPQISFRDLAIQQRENDLVGASFGRGFFILDDYSPLRHVSEEVLAREATLFPVRTAHWYVPDRPLGRGEKATQGADFFTAPNPPFGAVFTYHLADGYQTRKDARREEERERAKEGGDNPPPSWEELRREDEEEAPAVILTVRDGEDQVVRRVTGPVTAGFHRVAWDLRYPSLEAESGDGEEGGPFGPQGFLAAPGTYTVTLAKRIEGETTEIAGPVTFEVEPLPGREATLEGMTPAELTSFFQQLGELQRQVSGTGATIQETAERLERMRAALLRSTVYSSALDDRVRAMERQLSDLRVQLRGNQQKDAIGEPRRPAVQDRLQVVLIGVRLSTYGPTPTHRRSFQIAAADLAGIRGELNRLVEEDLPALERDLEDAGVPWTPGRPAPGD